MPTTLDERLAARTPIAFLPTPLHPLDAFSEVLGGGTRVWVKRDDQTGLALGGNKARKLEFIVHDALLAGATVLVTGGALQSNHARQTAAAAAKVGLRSALALVPGAIDSGDYTASGNVLLDDLLGAEVHRFPEGTDPVDAIASLSDELLARGERPYPVPVGGSDPIGSLGYALCARELLEQGPRFDAIVTATGSGGTQAGLLAGLASAKSSTPVVGISVSADRATQEQKVHALAAGVAELLETPAPPRSAVMVDDTFVGPGYGVPTDAMREAVRLLATTEGLLLDPVYTGKALAGLIAHVRAGSGPIGAARDVLFLHTGGQVGLFAYRSELTE